MADGVFHLVVLISTTEYPQVSARLLDSTENRNEWADLGGGIYPSSTNIAKARLTDLK